MHTIVFASQKGGVGKTTLTAHLAVAACNAGLGPVAVMDTDPQGSLAAWWNAREAENLAFVNANLSDLKDQLDELAGKGAGLVLIDTPPAMTHAIRAVVQLADLVIIPTLPSPNDLRAIGRTVELVEETGRRFVFVVNGSKPNTSLTAQAAAALSVYGIVAPAFLGHRIGYAAAMTDGRTIQELDPRSAGATEIAALWDFVRAQVAPETKTPAGNAPDRLPHVRRRKATA